MIGLCISIQYLTLSDWKRLSARDKNNFKLGTSVLACYQPRPYYEAQDPANGWEDLIPINKTFKCWNCADTEENCSREFLWGKLQNWLRSNLYSGWIVFLNWMHRPAQQYDQWNWSNYPRMGRTGILCNWFRLFQVNTKQKNFKLVSLCEIWVKQTISLDRNLPLWERRVMNAVVMVVKNTRSILEKLKILLEWDVSPSKSFGSDGILMTVAFRIIPWVLVFEVSMIFSRLVQR